MKKFIYMFLLSLSFVSCVSDLDNNVSEKQNAEGVLEVKNGYLSFSNDSVLKAYLENVESQGLISRSGNFDVKSVGRFQSIASLKKARLVSRSERDDSEEDDEMSLDEFNVMKAEELLVDPVLEEIMDTTLRVQVSDRLYKITKYGTFSVPVDSSLYLSSVIENFDTTLVKNCTDGSVLKLPYGITYSNTFCKDSSVDYDLEPVVASRGGGGIESIANLHAGYNTKDYAWKNHSVWQKVWDWARGKDVCRENNFDKKHRVQMEVFNVNYQFYASAGVKVKMQRRKKFLFVSYWVGEKADKIAVGFNSLTGSLKMTNPTSFSAISPTNSSYWGKFQSTINGMMTDFIIGNCPGLPVVKNWVNGTTLLVLPKVSLVNGKIHTPQISILNSLYDASLKSVEGALTSINNKYFSEIHKKVYPKDPRVAYMVWGESEYSFDKSKPYLMGVQEYNATDGKTVRFDQSFGFSYVGGGIKGFLPTEFKISEIDAFGAAYYKGQWRGLRIVGKK